MKLTPELKQRIDDYFDRVPMEQVLNAFSKGNNNHKVTVNVYKALLSLRNYLPVCKMIGVLDFMDVMRDHDIHIQVDVYDDNTYQGFIVVDDEEPYEEENYSKDYYNALEDAMLDSLAHFTIRLQKQ